MWHVTCMEGGDVDAVPTEHGMWGRGNLKLSNTEICYFFLFGLDSGSLSLDVGVASLIIVRGVEGQS